jgi:hypothetical protein
MRSSPRTRKSSEPPTPSHRQETVDMVPLEVVSNEDLPSPKPGNLGAFARFAAPDNFEVSSEKTYVCDVGRPSKTDYFRTHADKAWWVDFHLLEFTDASGQRNLYFVDPGLSGLPELEGQVKRRRLVPYVTLRGGLGVWPIGVENTDNGYVRSALLICQEAVDTWMLCIAKREIGQYRAKPAQGNHAEPVWPEMTLEQILALAFPPEKQILERDHPVLAKLRGE